MYTDAYNAYREAERLRKLFVAQNDSLHCVHDTKRYKTLQQDESFRSTYCQRANLFRGRRSAVSRTPSVA